MPLRAECCSSIRVLLPVLRTASPLSMLLPLRPPLFRWALLVLFLAAGLGQAPLLAQSDSAAASVDPLSPRASSSSPPVTSDAVVDAQGYVSMHPVPAGDSARTAVVLTIRDGWHVNAHEPPLNYLIGTSLDLTAPEGIALHAPTYPPSHRLAFEFARDSLDVYAGRTPIFLSVQVHSGSTPGTQILRGDVRVQACNDQTCLRPSTVSVEIPVEVGAADANARSVNEEVFETRPSGRR